MINERLIGQEQHQPLRQISLTSLYFGSLSARMDHRSPHSAARVNAPNEQPTLLANDRCGRGSSGTRLLHLRLEAHDTTAPLLADIIRLVVV